MIFNANGLELDTEKKETSMLSHAAQAKDILGQSPELEDYFDRLVTACTLAPQGKKRWEEMKIGEATHFALNDEGNLVIPVEEFGLLHQGLKIILEKDPVDTTPGAYKSEKGEFLTRLLATVDDNLPPQTSK